MLYDFLREGSIQFQKTLLYKYEINSKGKIYRGDTLTSAWTVFKKYLTYLWEKNDIPQSYFVKYKGTIEVPDDKDKLFYKTLKDYVIDRGTHEDDFRKTIFGVMSYAAKEFLNNYMTSGNYIVVPEYFNVERSNGGEWDTADRMLCKLFQYYHYKDKDDKEEAEKRLAQMFSVKGKDLKQKEKNLKQSVDYCVQWLKDSQATSWDKFIEIHCLQDFVGEIEEGEKGKYGQPISLKTKESIDCCIDVEYDPMPKTLEACETFFQTANEKILARGKRIYEKICAQND
jgi:hypothetical protein